VRDPAETERTIDADRQLRLRVDRGPDRPALRLTTIPVPIKGDGLALSLEDVLECPFQEQLLRPLPGW